MRTASAQPTTILEAIAGWVVDLRREEFPPAALNQAKLLLLDTLGCAFAALSDGVAQGVVQVAYRLGGEPRCTVIGMAEQTSVTNAVLANGTLIRVLDLNDYVISAGENGLISGHPSDNIPVALAFGELLDRAGREVVEAIVLGYQLSVRLRELMGERTKWDGVSSSAIVAAAMAGYLMRLERLPLAHAMALAATRAPTPAVVRAGNISAAKSIANALVAETATLCALLAEQPGLTGPLAIIEHERGLRDIFPRRDALATVIEPLGDHPDIMRAKIKRYPCLATGQGTVAAALELHRALGGDVSAIEEIEVCMADYPTVRRHQQDPDRRRPLSREAADHSFEFLAAVALIDGRFGPEQYDGERWTDPQVVALMERTRLRTDPAWQRRAPESYPCTLTVRCRDGRLHIAEVPYPPGAGPDGISLETVLDKLASVTARTLSEEARERLADAVLAFDHAPDCNALSAALRLVAG